MVAIVKQNRKSVLIKQRKGVCGSKEPGSRSLKRWSLGVPTVAQWVKDQAFSLSLRWYRFNPGPAQWVKDRHCCSCGSDLVPSLWTCICHGCGPKKGGSWRLGGCHAQEEKKERRTWTLSWWLGTDWFYELRSSFWGWGSSPCAVAESGDQEPPANLEPLLCTGLLKSCSGTNAAIVMLYDRVPWHRWEFLHPVVCSIFVWFN